MRRALMMMSVFVVAAACSGASTLTGSPPASASPPPTSAAPTAADPELAGAVADALATIDEIDRLYQKPSEATFGLISEVATSGRASLAREPARITTLEPFHAYDLLLQLFELNAVIKDGAQMVKDHDFLVSAEIRGKIAALVP
jgi:hypothetical protein